MFRMIIILNIPVSILLLPQYHLPENLLGNGMAWSSSMTLIWFKIVSLNSSCCQHYNSPISL